MPPSVINWRLAISSAFVALAVSGCAGGEKSVGAERPREMPVKLATVNAITIEDTSKYLGVLKSRKSVTLKSRVEGQISNIFVQSGAEVAQGTAILQVDAERQAATVDSSKAAAESYQAEKENMMQTMRSLKATREARVSNLQFAKQQYERYIGLQQQGAVAMESVDQHRNALRAAEAELQAIDAQIQAQNAVISRTDKILKQSHLSTHEQQVQLGYYKILAPFSGMVGDIPVRLGDFVDTSTALTTVDQQKPLELYVYIPAEQASRLRKGMQINLLDSKASVIGTCSVFFISPQVRNENQSVLVKATYDNAQGLLRSNQEVNASVVWSKGPRVVIPTNSVSRLSGQDFVFVAESQGNSGYTIHQKPVTLGDIRENSFVVLSGLHAGEKIVVSDVSNLADGMPVVPKS